MDKKRKKMAKETKGAKCVFVCNGVCFSVLCFILGIFYLTRAANVNQWDSDGITDENGIKLNDLIKAPVGGEGHVYDLYPFYACNDFDDNALALKLKADITAELAKSDCGEECKRFGTGWHHIMLANGIVLILLSITYIFYTIGAYVFATRCIAACLNMWLGCAHFLCIIATALYRFNT